MYIKSHSYIKCIGTHQYLSIAQEREREKEKKERKRRKREREREIENAKQDR